MPATAVAAFADRSEAVSRQGNHVTADVPYIVFDATDEADALDTVYAAAASSYEGLTLDKIDVDERINETTFRVVVHYRRYNQTSEGEEPGTVTTFDTTGGTQHITQSINTVTRLPTGAPDCQGAIGYDGENVEGVDIVVPTYRFSETHYVSPATVTQSFRNNIADMTGKINLDTFRGFEPYEVLFLGASGSRRGDGQDDLWEITYQFAVSRKRTSFNVGYITVGLKRGWDYMWVRYGDDVDAGALVKRPTWVYLEQVYEGASFSGLGI